MATLFQELLYQVITVAMVMFVAWVFVVVSIVVTLRYSPDAFCAVTRDGASDTCLVVQIRPLKHK